MGVEVADHECRDCFKESVCEEVVEAVSALRDLMVDVDHSEEEVISVLNVQHDGRRRGQGVCRDVVHEA